MSTGSAPIQVLLFGAPEILRQGSPVRVDTRKAIALLAYLAVSEGSTSRDLLCAMFWPESNQSRARGALRRTLSSVRSVVGGEAVTADRETVDLLDSELDVDAIRFSSLVAEGTPEALAEAVGLYRGDFLAGFTVRGSPEFEDWHRLEADRFRRAADGALRRSAEIAVERGDLNGGIDFAQRRVEIDPLNEPAHLMLMLAEARAGRRSQAISRYREMVRILEEDLGVAPLDETKEVYEAIRRGDHRVPQEPAVVPLEPLPDLDSAASHPRLVGRDRELDALVNGYRSAGRSGAVLAIEGEAGIGKTRLATAVVEHAKRLGAATAFVRCHEGERELPYAPLTALFRDLAALGDIDELTPAEFGSLSTLLPELSRQHGSASEPTTGPEAQIRFLEGLRSALTKFAGRGPHPGLVVFDDLHLADAATVNFVLYAARRLNAPGLALLITLRYGEVGETNKLRRLISARAAEARAVEVELSRLDEDDVAELVQAIGGEDLGAEALSRVQTESEGVPFFVVEYVRAIIEGRSPDHAPEAVTELVAGRLDALDGVALQVATAAAVIGRRFDDDLVRGVSGRREEEVAETLEALTRRGLISVATDGTSTSYDFTHDMLREVAYSRTGPARRRLLHRRAAEILSAAGKPSAATAAEGARHFTLAGDAARGALLHAEAGERAAEMYANRDALTHFEAALTLGHEDVGSVREMMGDLLARLGQYGSAREEYEAAAAFAASDSMARLEHKLGRLHHRTGDWETARNHLEEALEGGTNATERISVLADLAVNSHRAGDVADAEALAEEAAVIAETSGDKAASAKTANVVGLLALSGGDFDLAVESFERVRELAGTTVDVEMEIAGLNNLALTHGRSGHHARSLDLLERALQLCRKVGDRHHEAALLSNQGDALFGLGRVDEAMVSVKASAEIMTEIGSHAGTLTPEVWKLTEW